MQVKLAHTLLLHVKDAAVSLLSADQWSELLKQVCKPSCRCDRPALHVGILSNITTCIYRPYQRDRPCPLAVSLLQIAPFYAPFRRLLRESYLTDNSRRTLHIQKIVSGCAQKIVSGCAAVQGHPPMSDPSDSPAMGAVVWAGAAGTAGDAAYACQGRLQRAHAGNIGGEASLCSRDIAPLPAPSRLEGAP